MSSEVACHAVAERRRETSGEVTDAQLRRGIGFQPVSHRQDADATGVDAAGLIARYEIEMVI
jgi:hypothetical protein